MPTHPTDSPATDPSPPRRPLEVIFVRKQCTKDWNEMTGDSQSRFCPHCQKHVHNLSAMYAGDAERLICESAGRFCVRFYRDQAGKIITLDYESPSDEKRARIWSLLAMIMGGLAAAGAALLFKPPFVTARWTSLNSGDMGGGPCYSAPASPPAPSPTASPSIAPATQPAEGAAGEGDGVGDP